MTDPVRPRLLCHFTATSVHLFTGDTFTYLRPAGPDSTQVVLHSMGSESLAGTFPLGRYESWGGYMAYTPDASYAATAAQDNPDADIHIWLASQRSAVEVRTFPVPIADCVCRFGLPQPTLSFSADGQYLVSGWPVGKGGSLAPMQVLRVTDQKVVSTFDPIDAAVVWSHTGHTLYVTGYQATSAWTPEGGLVALPGVAPWQVEPGVSADGAFTAYTAFTSGMDDTTLRVFVYDFANKKTRMLIDALRSEVVFVKDGWVWYHDEVACSINCAGGTEAGTTTYVMNLATGSEVIVDFTQGESPDALQSGWGPGEFWPNS